MSYILKDINEAQRLDDQSLIEQFSLKHELQGIHLEQGTSVLDAGCGSGVLCQYIEQNFHGVSVEGCDLDELSLAYAKKKATQPSTKFFKHDLQNQSLNKKYDYIFNRYVAHHLGIEGMRQILKNLYHALTPGGRLCLIDIDGLFANLSTSKTSLIHQIDKVQNAFAGDLFTARKLPELLHETGLKQIDWKIHVMDFRGREKELEIDQWQKRFESALPFYVNVFGSETAARTFFQEYITEASKENIPLFYNKFVIQAHKP